MRILDLMCEEEECMKDRERKTTGFMIQDRANENDALGRYP